MRGYEEAIELHREILDMASRESAEHRLLTVFVRRYGEQIVHDPSFDNPAVVMMLRILAEVNPVLAVNRFEEEHWEVFKKEAQRLLDNPAAYAKSVTRAATSRLAESETVWASPTLVSRALEADPAEVVIPDQQSLPFERAFVMLGEPVRTAGSMLIKVEAVSWDVLTDERVLVRTYGRITDEEHPLHGVLQPDMIGLQRFGGAMDMVNGMDVADTDIHGALVIRLMSLLARRVDDEQVDDVRVAVAGARTREAQRTAKKANLKPEVNVIYVQPEKRRVLGGSKDGSGTMRHRVRGHWRHQPYGPERALRRWTFIAEHERGQGDLDEHERVYVEKD